MKREIGLSNEECVGQLGILSDIVWAILVNILSQYLYAFNIVPLCHMKLEELVKQPDDVTEIPYGKLQKNVYTNQNTQVRYDGTKYVINTGQLDDSIILFWENGVRCNSKGW